MAALIEEAVDPRSAGTTGIPNGDALTQGLYGTAAASVRAGQASSSSNLQDAIKSRMPDLVKGAGMAFKGGNQPLTNYSDIMNRSAQAARDLRVETSKGFTAKHQVVGELNQNWLDQYGAFKTALTMRSEADVMAERMAIVMADKMGMSAGDLYKSFTASNLGIGSVSGLTPFNLLAPSRLIYPVYTVR